MSDAKSVTTPLVTTLTLELHTNIVIYDLTKYQIIIDSFQYLSLTWFDNAFTVNILS